MSAPVALLLVVGPLAVFAAIAFSRRAPGADVEDYMVARGSQGAGALAWSFLASGMGAWVLFAPPEVGAFVGVVAVAGYALGAAAPIALYALLGPRMRAVAPAGHSLTEYVRLRFGRVFHGYVVGVSALYMLVFLTAELTAIAAVTGILSGLDGRIAVVVVALVTLAYTAHGGLRASLRTDRWQAFLVLALLAVGVGVVLSSAVPDTAAAIDASGGLRVDRLGVEAALTLVAAVTAANMFHQGYWQRVWAARDRAALVRGALGGAAASVPVVAVLGMLGLVAAGAGLDLGTPPVPFFALFADQPGWVAGVVLVLGVALVASTVDTLENGLAALVVVERPALSLRAARWITVALVVPAAVVAFQGYSVLRLLLVADLLCATVVVPAMLGLGRRTTPVGALAGAVAGLLGAVLPGLVTEAALVDGLLLATFPDAVPTLPPFAGALLASTVVTLVVSRLTPPGEEPAAVNARIPVLGRPTGR